MIKKAAFIGRAAELARLRRLHSKKSASFIVAKGRRRVGKSRLIDEFSKDFDYYYKFEGLAPEEGITPEDQLNEFCNQISRQFKAAKAIYQDWSDAFWAVGERVQKGKILLFFDEISWMADKEATFLAKLKSFWDNSLSKNPQLVFVVCSSASSWVEKNLMSSTAFVGRVSFTLTLDELPLFNCNQFWPNKTPRGKPRGVLSHNTTPARTQYAVGDQSGALGSPLETPSPVGARGKPRGMSDNKISAYEKFKILSVTGGIPRYLEEINPKNSAEENIKQLCFTDGGLLMNEFKRIFSDLFLRESKFYEKIVQILAGGAKEPSEIQDELSKTHDQQQYGRLPEYLWELQEAGFIRRDYTWNIKTGVETKLSRYRLQDNYLRFYLKYIQKNLDKIKRHSFAFKSLSSLPAWNTMMGLQFENLVLNNRRAIHTLLSISADDIINDNPFFQTKTNRTAGCQIDYLIQTKFNCLYICEIKFSKNKVDASIIDEVENKIKALSYPRGFSCRPVLIHVNGVAIEVIESDYFSHIIDMSDLLETGD